MCLELHCPSLPFGRVRCSLSYPLRFRFLHSDSFLVLHLPLIPLHTHFAALTEVCVPHASAVQMLSIFVLACAAMCCVTGAPCNPFSNTFGMHTWSAFHWLYIALRAFLYSQHIALAATSVVPPPVAFPARHSCTCTCSVRLSFFWPQAPLPANNINTSLH